MKDGEIVDRLAQAVADGTAVDPRGSGSLAGRLAGAAHAPGQILDMSGCEGVLRYIPEDLTITVRANTPVEALDLELAACGQECALDVWGPGRGTGTVAGRVAAGLAGRRALSRGSVRDLVLGLRFVTGDGQVANAGGATVKNVTGYDVVRLLTGSWGTLAVFTEVTLKVSPIPAQTGWYVTDGDARTALKALYAPSALVQVDGLSHFLLEGDADDCREQAAAAGLREGAGPTVVSTVRVSVPPAMAKELADLPGAAVEPALGLVHVPALDDLVNLRQRVEAAGGRVLVLDPDATVDPFRSSDRSPYDDRLKQTFDPQRVLAPWRRP